MSTATSGRYCMGRGVGKGFPEPKNFEGSGGQILRSRKPSRTDGAGSGLGSA